MIRIGSIEQWSLLGPSVFSQGGNVVLHLVAPQAAVITLSAGDDIVAVPVSGVQSLEFAAIPGLEVSVEGVVYYKTDFGHALESRELPLLLEFAPELMGRVLSAEEAKQRRDARNARLAGARAESLAAESASLSKELAQLRSMVDAMAAANSQPKPQPLPVDAGAAE